MQTTTYVSTTIMQVRDVIRSVSLKINKFLNKEKLAFIVAFLAFIFLITLNDADYFWHLKTGEYIFTRHALPAGDIFSYTRLGNPWVLHEWLFEVVLYAMFAWLGAVGVKLFTISIAMSALAIMHVFLKRISVPSAFAFFLILAAIVPLSVGISPRPQLVSYVFFSFFLYVFLSHKYFQESQLLPTLPFIMVVWVNAHGAYVVGIALAGLFAACEWASYWIKGERSKEKRQGLLRLTLAAIATSLASLANPEFARHWLYPFQVMGLDATRLIAEWQSPNFHDWQPRVFLMLVLALFFSYIYAARKPDLTELIVPSLFTFTGFMASRHVPLAVLTIVPFIGIGLSRGTTRNFFFLWQRMSLSRFYKKWIGGGKQLGQGEHLLNWIVLLAIGCGLALYYPVFHAKDDATLNATLPIKAADFVLENHITGKMFNYYDEGGYLIYRLGPDRKVFIDGRADLYGDQFLGDFIDIYFGHASWKEKFDRLAIDYVICGKDAAIRQLLLAEGSFRDAYIDESHAVLLRNIPKNRSLLIASGK